MQAVVFSPQGEYFASGGQDGKVMVWKSNINSAKSVPEKVRCCNSMNLLEVRKLLSSYQILKINRGTLQYLSILINQKFFKAYEVSKA